MFPNPLPLKFTQISEQALAPQQVPLIVGHDLFVLAQQDVRKIEDSRLFSLSKLMPGGDLKPINILDPKDWLLHLLNLENLLSNQNLQQLLEFLNARSMLNQQCQVLARTPAQQFCSGAPVPSPCPQPMEVSMSQCENPVVASIDQQLQWNKCVNTSAPFPMTYSHGTSTTDINWHPLDNRNQQNMQKTSCCCCCNRCQSCGCSKDHCNKSTNTQKPDELLGAREQLKKKKLNFNFNYIT